MVAVRYLPTKQGITDLLRDNLRWVKSVEVIDGYTPHEFLVLVRLKWTAWFMLGWAHHRAKKKAHALVWKNAAVGTEGRVEIIL